MSKSKSLYEKYMVFVGIGGQLLYYCQAFDIFTTRSAEDISLLGFSINFFALVSWLTYGIILRNKVLIIANLFGCLGSMLVLIGTYLYS